MPYKFHCPECDFECNDNKSWYAAYKAALHVKQKHGEERWRQIIERLRDFLEKES